MSSPSDDVGPVSPAELIRNLQTVLLDLQAHPYPEIPNPEGVPKRASVALIVRIQLHYSHWPPPPPSTPASSSFPSQQQQNLTTDNATTTPPEEPQQPESQAERVKSFFAQDWVQHGDPEVLFIKRAARKGDKWTSHVALPGGRRDPEDADDCAAAVREAWEEVGLDLSEQHAVRTGNLPQQVVSSGWGKIPYDSSSSSSSSSLSSDHDRRSWGLMHKLWLADDDPRVRLMVLCPYVFLMTSHAIPPLRLQPTEVASAHWVPLRALLSPAHRTFWYQDVSSRISQQDFGVARAFHRLSIGDMMFAAVRLVPSESVYCSSIAEFLPDEQLRSEPLSLNHTAPLIGRGKTPTSPVDKPLLLWGLTLGIMGDFLDMVPPYNALRAWTYPTFTTLDVRIILHLMTHRYRQERDKELDAHKVSFPSAEEKARKEGRPAARLRLDQRRSDANSVGLLLAGYYKLVRRAVLVTFVVRALVGSLLLVALWRSRKNSLVQKVLQYLPWRR